MIRWILSLTLVRENRMTLEEVKFLQKQRERKSGIPAVSINASSSSSSKTTGAPGVGFGVGFAKVGGHRDSAKNDAAGAPDAEKEDLVLHDNFAQETAVMVEDPNMYVISSRLFSSLPVIYIFIILYEYYERSNAATFF
jgi:hypothetical protein